MALVGFTQKEVGTDEKGPQLPEPVVNSRVLGAQEVAQYNFPVTPEGAQRPAIELTVIFPVADDTEIKTNKAGTRATLGLAKAIELAFAYEGYRVQFTGSMFAQIKAEDTETTETA